MIGRAVSAVLLAGCLAAVTSLLGCGATEVGADGPAEADRRADAGAPDARRDARADGVDDGSLDAEVDQAGGFTLSLEPARLTVPAGASASVEVRIARGAGLSGAVTLSVLDLPAGVTATFSEVMTEQTSVMLTVNAAADAVRGKATLTVRGQAGALVDQAVLALNVAGLTVSGRLVDFDGRYPVPGATVAIGLSTTMTDPTGVFSLGDVRAPYDVVVTAMSRFVTVYRGLTRSDPTLAVFGTGTAPYGGEVSGTVTAVPPLASGGLVFVLTGGERLVPDAVIAAPNGAYDLTPKWGEEPATEVEVHALALERNAAFRPVAFPAYGQTTVALNNDQTVAGLDVAVSPIATATLSGTFAFPPGTSNPLWLSWGFFGRTYTFLDREPNGDISTAVPDIAGATFAIGGTVDDGGGGKLVGSRTALVANQSGVMVSFGSPVELQAPADQATGVVPGSDRLAWAAAPETVFRVRLTAPDFVLHWITVEPELALAEVIARGLAIPGGTGLSWQVDALDGQASVDEVAVPGAFTLFSTTVPPARDAVGASSPPRRFTTAP